MLSTQTLKSMYSLIFYVMVVIHLNSTYIFNSATFVIGLSVQFSSVQLLSRVWFCDTMNRSTPGLPVHHQLPEFTQTRLHRVRDVIQPSHPLSSPSPPASNPFQHQSLFQYWSLRSKWSFILNLIFTFGSILFFFCSSSLWFQIILFLLKKSLWCFFNFFLLPSFLSISWRLLSQKVAYYVGSVLFFFFPMLMVAFYCYLVAYKISSFYKLVFLLWCI